MVEFARRGVTLSEVAPLVNGAVPDHGPPETSVSEARWALPDGGAVVLTVMEEDGVTRLDVRADGIAEPLDSLGLRFGRVTGMRRYLRNGYQSWDGSWFAEPGTPAGDGPPAKAPTLGFAMTALLPEAGGTIVLGADRHDRFQTRFGFGGTAEAMSMTVETLLDRTGATAMESLFLFDGDEVETELRRWSERVASASPLPPRVGERITGWCSWYNHYAAIDEVTILTELAGATTFRDRQGAPLGVFQIDDGFTPEMGDWLDVKPQFPRGMQPILNEIAAAGFMPGLWIAPFLVGNRSKLAAAHPEWLVGDRATGRPLVAFQFYGEFRWHKRSEEYHVLDITHPDAAAYLATVIRTWVHDWGARYLKCDFLLHGAEYGPERATWHEPSLSRIAIWRRMMTLIREQAGDEVIIAGCGSPLWASVGLVDAVRIGRDVGVSWHGDYSAESLLRDLQTRNHGHGILWQADPDCVLLRNRFHELSEGEIEALARFAGGAGGILMTSDTLADLSPGRARLFAKLLRQGATACDFPGLGQDGIVTQQVRRDATVIASHRFNPTDDSIDGIPPHSLVRE